MSLTLACLVGDVGEFLSSYWSKQARLRRGVPSSLWQPLLTLQDVDRLLASPRTEVHLLRDSQWVDRRAYTYDVNAAPLRPAAILVDPGKVFRHLEDGATAVLLGLQEWWPPLTRVCNDLGRAFNIPVQANVYVTPPHRSGARHHDLHDVIVLQIHGTKRWTVWAHPHGEEAGDGYLHAALAPGDCLYVPRRHTHAVATEDSVSVHITFGVASPTWKDVMTRLIAETLPSSILEATVPLPSPDASDSRLHAEATGVLGVLRDVVQKLDADTVARMAASDLQERPMPSWDGQLLSLVASSRLSDDSRLARRHDLACGLVLDDGVLRLRLADRELQMPGELSAAMGWMVSRASFRVADLMEYLDLDSALVLVRRLIREGLLEVVPGRDGDE